jgi:ABC-2 type transport system permease protein
MIPFQPKAVAALAARTLRSAAGTPSVVAALLVFYLITGLLFSLPLFLEGQASIRGLLDVAPLLLALLAPALTMGLLAEELRTGTFETLATSPLEDWDIVLGKYLGFSALLGLLVAGLLYFPISVSVLSAPPGLDWGAACCTLLALLLQGLLFGAIGLFASSLTRSQAAAFLVAFSLCFALLACGRSAPMLPGALSSLARYASVEGHMDALARGVLDTRDLVYFATGVFAFLFLAVQRLEARRL